LPPESKKQDKGRLDIVTDPIERIEWRLKKKKRMRISNLAYFRASYHWASTPVGESEGMWIEFWTGPCNVGSSAKGASHFIRAVRTVD